MSDFELEHLLILNDIDKKNYSSNTRLAEAWLIAIGYLKAEYNENSIKLKLTNEGEVLLERYKNRLG